jgi:hypothetical protein
LPPQPSKGRFQGISKGKGRESTVIKIAQNQVWLRLSALPSVALIIVTFEIETLISGLLQSRVTTGAQSQLQVEIVCKPLLDFSLTSWTPKMPAIAHPNRASNKAA